MKITNENRKLVLYLDGKMDSNNALTREQEIFDALETAPDCEVVLDLGDLTYISSSGLRVLTRLKKNTGDVISLRNVTPEVYEILDMTGFASLFKVEKKLREISVDGCDVIGRGTFRTVYRIAPDMIVKVVSSPDSLAMLREEQARSRKAFLRGIHTAIPFDIVRVGNSYGSVYELVNAQTLNVQFREHPEEEEDLLREYAEAIRQLHGIEAEPGELPDNRQIFLQYLEALDGILPPGQHARLLAMFTAMPENFHLVHGDIQMQNVMYTQEGPMLIDMDTLGVGDPVFEFAPMQVTYEAFSEDNPQNGMNFAGIPNERYCGIWRRTLEYYMEGYDADALERAVSRIRLVGCVRFLYLVSVLHVEEGPLSEVRIRHAVQHIRELLPCVDSLSLF